MERLNEKVLNYFEAYRYSKLNDCPVEIKVDDDTCIRFEIINNWAEWYYYNYRTGNTETIDKEELNSLFPDGFINEDFRVSTTFARIVNRRKQNEQ
jgi:hypothetical protein